MNLPFLLSIQLSPALINALKISAIIVGIFIAVTVLTTVVIVPYTLFICFLIRTGKKKWTRECSSKDEQQQAMYAAAEAWRDEHSEFRKDVSIVNEGLRLYGEYFDFGHKRAVIIVPGRTEGLVYGYYFAKPYAESGYNVLSIDQRAHGKSDGKVNTVGFREHKDLFAWVDMLKESFGVESVVFHGICIGASCSMFAATSEKCPKELSGMVVEGMYPNFYESFKNHVIAFKQPVYPTMPLLKTFMQVHMKVNIKYGPRDVIHKLRVPLLMLHSKEDLYSLPQTADELYNTCASEQKRLVWFETGAHSRLRITDTERYDSSIRTFLTEAVSGGVAQAAGKAD